MTRLLLLLGALLLWCGQAQAFDSLMPGMTPGSFSVPVGWKVYATQDFESGVLSSGNEFMNNGGGVCTVGETLVSPVQAHRGSKSTCNRVNATFKYNNNGWGFESVPATDIYVSWWDYIDSNALFSIDWYIFQFMKSGLAAPPTFEEVYLDILGQQYNGHGGGLGLQSQGVFEQGVTTLGFYTIPLGAWHQREVWAHFDTTNTSFVKVYTDGFLTVSKGPTNLNGQVNMFGARLQLGAVYSRPEWGFNSSGVGSCTAWGVAPVGLNCYDYTNCRCPPNPPIFNHYMDDIIVLIPGSGGGGTTQDTTPPSPPTALTVQ